MKASFRGAKADTDQRFKTPSELKNRQNATINKDMPEAPRRKRFQIHLSTALIMMIAAGFLIWANVTPQHSLDNATMDDTFRLYPKLLPEYVDPVKFQIMLSFTGARDIKLEQKTHGWPAMVVRKFDITITFEARSKKSPLGHTGYLWSAIAINLAVALSILFTIWFVCEWWIRRRAAKRGT